MRPSLILYSGVGTISKKIAILADFPLHVLPSSPFPSPSGHYATWLPQLAEAFAGEKDFEFHWLTLDPSLSEELSIQAWSQTFHALPSWKRGRAATLFLGDRRRIRKKLRWLQPDLVHGWGSENIWGWAAASSGFPNIFSLQGLLSEYLKLGGVSLRDRLMAKIEIYVLNKAQVVTTESPWAKEKIEKTTGRKDVLLVEYGVPQKFFEAEWGPSTGQPYALMVGTADYRKGIDFAVRLFGRPNLRDFPLKVAGGVTPFAEKWKKESTPNIEWLGRCSQEQIIQLLAGARCLILPTRADVCANVVKEARVIGLPVVVSPHGGHTQYIQHGQNGYVCRLDSAVSWEKALLQIFCEPDATTGRFMREDHRKLLRPERTAQGFLALYRKMTSLSRHQGET